MKTYYKEVSLKKLCGLFGKSRQAWYQSINEQEKKAFEDEIVLKLVKDIRRNSPRCGVRKLYYLIKKDLEKQSIEIGRDKLFDILSHYNMLVKPKRRYTKTTNSSHWLRKYDDLTTTLEIEHSEQLWVSDITYIRIKGDFIYLALVTDAYSRKIVGWALGVTLSAEICINAAQMAISCRKRDCLLIHHSDRGVQYCSEKYVSLMTLSNISISMTQNGSPYENALAERINGIIKIDYECDIEFENYNEAYMKIKKSIMNYNEFSPHGSLDYLTPEQAELKTGELKKRW